jgi:GAF domain-containing protein
VLNVVRIPAGALCLNYGEENGPTSVVVTGLGDAFCPAIQESNLDDYIVNLVARLGGLVVLRDLDTDSKWEALEKEESFRHVRKLLLGQSLRTVVGISLQAKERVFGVLLLGTPDNRSFNPAELRLLLALGHQIGAAQRRAAHPERNRARAEFDAGAGCAVRAHLFGDEAPAGCGQPFHRVLRPEDGAGAFRD